MAGGSFFFPGICVHIAQLRKIAGLGAEAEVLSAAPAALDADLDGPLPQQASQKHGRILFAPEHDAAALSDACELPSAPALAYLYVELGAAQKLAPKYASESERGARAVYLKVGLQQVSALDLKALVINSVLEFDKGAAGRTIRLLRRERGLSQEVLSGFAGIARTHLTMIENGTKQANFETIWRIALALDLRPSQLVEQIERECLAPGSTAADAKK